ncbi:HCNGP-like protein-domain-containing protein, partial [Halteromyces radiatus]|uniref:HCNGP-like protein-domain-containing protein n=1 Tax=Halteromyces radiatus TaxID=101107 RepID=UPI00221F18B4
MGKLPGLVNYSDEEDQSSSSSDEAIQQQPTKPVSPSQKTDDRSIQQNHTDMPSTPETTLPTILASDRSTRLKTILTPAPIPGIDNWGIPSEPDDKVDPDRLEKIQHFLSLRQSGHRLNDHLQRNKAFRNPRIYAKLVEFVDLDETGSNFPPDQFDPKGFPASSYIDGILETQRRLAEEKAQQQQQQGRSQIAFVPSKPSTTVDTSAKLAAAMANAAKIANKI